MSNSLHQIQVTYNGSEDRMLLQVSTTLGHEYRIWLTRKMVASIYKHLMTCVEPKQDEVAKTDGTLATKNSMTASKFKKNMSVANLSDTYKHKDGVTITYPLGEKAVLLTRYSFSKSGSVYAFKLFPAQGIGMDLKLNDRLVSPLLKMLYDCCEKADWKLDLELPSHLIAKEKVPVLVS